MKTTNIYFDFEFIDDGQTITPISLGMCTDYGKQLYLEYQFDPSRANDWVRKNVFPHLEAKSAVGSQGNTRVECARLIREWVWDAASTRPRFVGYYPSYDWVLLCQHFGNMMQVPDGWPMMPTCLMQLADDIGIPSDDFPKQSEKEHHALEDAKWIRELDGFLYKRWERDSP